MRRIGTRLHELALIDVCGVFGLLCRVNGEHVLDMICCLMSCSYATGILYVFGNPCSQHDLPVNSSGSVMHPDLSLRTETPPKTYKTMNPSSGFQAWTKRVGGTSFIIPLLEQPSLTLNLTSAC